MTRPLEGLRILTFEQYGAGPYGTMLLAELGAEVIKVENAAAGGDASRGNGPYFLGENDSEYYQTFSRSKKSVTLDIKSREGRAAFEALARESDAVANNLRGDQPAKLGLTFEALRAVNPKIVCAHISAYGRDNERTAWPGFDYLMQAECGFTFITGEPDGPPVRFGLSVVDFMTGALMAAGLLAAVMRARESGEGADVDCCLFDTALHQLSYPGTWYLNQGDAAPRLPRGAHPSVAPSQFFRTADGWIMIMAQNQTFWENLCRVVGRADLIEDPRFPTPNARAAYRDELTQALDAALMTAPTAHWVQALAGKTPCGPVYDMARALDSPFPQATGMIDRVPHPDRADGLRMLACPVKINGARMPGKRSPKLGEHNEELLGGARKT
ncbi:MAG: CoA transferase [Alphaproteobacteria bacterium]|nr:CoA transferase [Alphaproteobacteria bacterium]